MSTILIQDGTIVNEGEIFDGDILIEDDRIKEIGYNIQPDHTPDRIIDAHGCVVMPGVIDSHVHFREPGLTHKADIESESRAAAYGGVTTYFEMPNTKPQTTTLEALEEKFRLAAQKSHVNYSFFYGATNDNVESFAQLDRHRIPGIKLFMGSSTGNMLVDKQDSLDAIFAEASRLDLPLMAHCEDTDIINRNIQEMLSYTPGADDIDLMYHLDVRSREACIESTKRAVALANKHHARLHVAHLSTKEELQMMGNGVTGEACIAHLWFEYKDYFTRQTAIKCNPAVKTWEDRYALRLGLMNGQITTIATDHAPHLWEEKQGGCLKAASGMPMVQFSLPAMLWLYSCDWLTLERLVELMCHNPAKLFGVKDRGFLREGYKADIVIIKQTERPMKVTKDIIQSKCKWSPMEDEMFYLNVYQTICNGRIVYDNGHFDETSHGEAVEFR